MRRETHAKCAPPQWCLHDCTALARARLETPSRMVTHGLNVMQNAHSIAASVRKDLNLSDHPVMLWNDHDVWSDDLRTVIIYIRAGHDVVIGKSQDIGQRNRYK